MNDSIDKLKKLFAGKNEITLAFLFGSKAKDRARPASDYDLAVWFGSEYSMQDVNKLWQELETILHCNVDLIVLNKARPTVAWAALRGQKLLIRDFKLYLRLFLDISREAEDIQDFTAELWSLKKRYAQS